jgi:predicted TPR repeat methyltransferase
LKCKHWLSPKTFEQAQAYVGSTGQNYFIVGKLQLELLKMNGCTPASHVLEVGCGCLVAGRPIMEFLSPDHYVGIEPNKWLIDAVKKGLPDTIDLIARKRPIFLKNKNFDATKARRRFDFVISHSILSHAAHRQYFLFLNSIKKVLAPGGVVIASIRFLDRNGNVMGDSNDSHWVYPNVSYFSWETVERGAAEYGFKIEWRRDYREFFIKESPDNHHDWIRLTA